jgi:hypothetical protein
MKKKATKEERHYMGLVAGLGCKICGDLAEIHHNTKNRGYGAKSSNYDIMPLCPYHHRGSNGIHHIGVKTWEAKYGDQDDLVNQVKLKIYSDILNSDYPDFEAKRIGRTKKKLEDYILASKLFKL